MAKLTGVQRQALRDALLDAFSTVDGFDEFMALRLSRSRAQITTADGLETIIFKVIEVAESAGWTEELLLGAAGERRHLKPLQDTVQELLVWVRAPDPRTRTPDPPTGERASPEPQMIVLDELRDALVAAYDDWPLAREIARRVGIVAGTLPSSTLPMRDWWWEAIQTLQRQGKLIALLDAAIADPTVAALKPRFEALRAQVQSIIEQGAKAPAPTLSSAERASLVRQLAAQRENLLLIEERMSEFVDPSEIPLQLVKSKRQTEARIAELEAKLRQQPGA